MASFAFMLGLQVGRAMVKAGEAPKLPAKMVAPKPKPKPLLHDAVITGAIGASAGPKVDPALHTFRDHQKYTTTPFGDVNTASAHMGAGGVVNYSTRSKKDGLRRWNSAYTPKGGRNTWGEPSKGWAMPYPLYSWPPRKK